VDFIPFDMFSRPMLRKLEFVALGFDVTAHPRDEKGDDFECFTY
jgi:hypothetical protein